MTTLLASRTMPHDADLELAVLGALMHAPDLTDEIRAVRGALLSPGEGQDGPDAAESGQAASVTPVAGTPAFAPPGEVRPAATVAPADAPVLPPRDKG